MGWGIVEAAPAKVNLTLRIVGRRADGYHLLDSVMVPLTLADRVTVSVEPRRMRRPYVRLRLRGAVRGVPRDGRNLAVRAALAFMTAAGEGGTIRIVLDKLIPAASGLGGGSSDAAAVLRALNRLCPRRVAPGTLATVAAGLGADVPFFVRCRPARVGGVGQVVRSFRGKLPAWIVLAVPRRGVSTAAAYAAFRLTRPRPNSKFSRFRYTVSHPANDLEAAVIPRRPDIGRLKRCLLEAGADAALMSGSGGAVFGTFGTRLRARAAARGLTGDVAVFVVRPLRAGPSRVRRLVGRSPSW